ncbi:MAG TPA: extracellular solute-binding protein [Solirubrobacteraceae bacterium]|nr:extracellular solute-binding protein [Solirubrobacteraceae bacterium]
MKLWFLAAALIGVLALAACGGSSSKKGSVNVLYAGSLEALMNDHIGRAFQKATGYTFSGYPAGSKDLASEIKGKVRVGDVFISASPKVNATLEGSANGNWVSWFAPFASTKLELGYNPSSSYAHALRSEPWYRVIVKPGFRLGFTDPKLDPKGVLAVAALEQVAVAEHQPALQRIATDQSDLFPEQDLVGRLQAGQLDAGFFYTVEANAAHIHTVPISPVDESATYTLTVLHHAPNAKGAEAFVKFLLSSQGQSLLHAAGLTLQTPKAVGSGVPASLSSAVNGG